MLVASQPASPLEDCPKREARKFNSRPRYDSAKLVVMVACTAMLAFLTINHLASLNGPSYWRWEWRAIPGSRIYPAMLLAVLPLFLAQILYEKNRRATWICLILVGASTLALQLITISMQSEPPDLKNNIVYDVSNPIVTSYFTDAARISSVGDFLRSFPARMASLNLHSRNKPPGTILYYLPFIKIWGYTSAAALAAGFATLSLGLFSMAA